MPLVSQILLYEIAVLLCVFVSRLENCAGKLAPSLYKYNQNFKINNFAISRNTETRHIFKPLLNGVLYFHELKKSTQCLFVTFGLRLSNVTQT